MRIQSISQNNYNNNYPNRNVEFKQNVYTVVELTHSNGIASHLIAELRRQFVYLAFRLNKINPEDCIRTITSVKEGKVEFLLLDRTTDFCKETLGLVSQKLLEKARLSKDKCTLSLLSTKDGNIDHLLMKIGAKQD